MIVIFDLCSKILQTDRRSAFDLKKFKWLSSIWRHTLCARHYFTFAKEGKIKRILPGIINYWNYKINVMYDIAELLLAVATQNNIMRTENRTWLWFESQYAGNVEALVAVGWKCSLSQTWHASGARLQCVFMAGGRMVVANYCSVCRDLGKVIFLFFSVFFVLLLVGEGAWGGGTGVSGTRVSDVLLTPSNTACYFSSEVGAITPPFFLQAKTTAFIVFESFHNYRLSRFYVRISIFERIMEKTSSQTC